MNKRRSLTPPLGMPGVAAGAAAMRRGGARQQVSDRVTFRRDGASPSASEPRGTPELVHQGWALNVSKGGLRAILDSGDDRPSVNTAKLELGDEYDIVVGDPEAPGNVGRRGRIVWLQEEPDGFVVGVEYVEMSGMHASAAPAAAASSRTQVIGAGEASEPPPGLVGTEAPAEAAGPAGERDADADADEKKQD